MSKRLTFGSQFEKLKALGAGSPLDERKPPVETKSVPIAPQGASPPSSSILEECLSTVDTVQNEQSSQVTVAAVDTVQNEPCPEPTVSSVDPLQHGFTRVPHSLLRGEVRFGDPLDFMVYMHLFTYSYGFGRREAHMSQAQLEKFTGAAKNTVKRSLERLSKQGWVKCIEEYERARVSRKWRVVTPEDRGGRSGPKGKQKGSKSDTVQEGQCPERTGSLSAVDPPTLAKMDSFKERDPKEKSKNSLSVKFSSDRLTRYFAELAPARKRESELLGYRDLARDFSEAEIDAALEFLQKHGLPGSGQSCHSPMAYLGKAIKEVLAQVEQARALERERGESQRRQAEERRRREEEDEQASREWAAREAAFNRAFSGEDRQAEVTAELCRGMPFLAHSQVGRTFAVGKWWDGLSQFERVEWAG